MWVKVDDRLPSHAKIKAAGRLLGPDGRALALAMATWGFSGRWADGGEMSDPDEPQPPLDLAPDEPATPLPAAYDGSVTIEEWLRARGEAPTREEAQAP